MIRQPENVFLGGTIRVICDWIRASKKLKELEKRAQ